MRGGGGGGGGGGVKSEDFRWDVIFGWPCFKYFAVISLF